jgi:Tol biopolymer transport system component
MTRPAIIRFTVAVPLALAVLFSVPAQRGGSGTTIARAGMTSSLGSAAPLHRMSNGKIAFFVGPGDPRLDVINPDGTGQKRLTLPCPGRMHPSCDIGGYAWSPNGTRLAFVQGIPGPNGPSPMSLFVINANGSGEKRLARCGQIIGYNWCGHRISWSPDGSRIVFSKRWSLYVVKVNGGVLRRLTHDCTVTFTHSVSGAVTGWDKKSCTDISPAWSPDGSRIAFTREGNTDSRLHVVNADDSGSKPLARLLGSVRDPVWSPDGRSIAFDALDGVYTVHADGSHLKLLVSGPPVSGPGLPSWSPDGTRILYASTPGYSTHTGGHYRLEVWVMNANGTGRRRLYHSACCTSTPGFPIWSPDGKYIAFDVDVSRPQLRPSGIYLMDADGRHLHRLTRFPRLIAWQPIP